jgi:hypothetical protein
VPYQVQQREVVKEFLKGVEQEIADRIENPLADVTPLFQRMFKRCLFS